MKITKAGQVSVPAPIRHRWNASNLWIEDRGDCFVVRPVPDDPIEAAAGIFADSKGPSSEEARRLFRQEERSAEERKYGKLPDGTIHQRKSK